MKTSDELLAELQAASYLDENKLDQVYQVLRNSQYQDESLPLINICLEKVFLPTVETLENLLNAASNSNIIDDHVIDVLNKWFEKRDNSGVARENNLLSYSDFQRISALAIAHIKDETRRNEFIGTIEHAPDWSLMEVSVDNDKIFFDSKDVNSISNGGFYVWSEFTGGVIKYVKQGWVQNHDNILSFFITDEADATQKKMAEIFEKTDIVAQLNYALRRLNPDAATDNFFEKVTHENGVIEYKLRISPENLDSILKTVSKYHYRGNDSILKLSKEVKLKPGVIRLFPIRPLDKKTSVMVASGCQMTEMPTVQLLHLMEGDEGKQDSFHWIPKRVEDELGIDRGSMLSILAKLTGQRVIEDGQTIIDPKKINKKIQTVDLDQDTINFYTRYGNCSEEDLRGCKSFEIKTVDFLACAKDVMSETLSRLKASKDKYDQERIPAIKQKITAIDNMARSLSAKKAAVQDNTTNNSEQIVEKPKSIITVKRVTNLFSQFVNKMLGR